MAVVYFSPGIPDKEGAEKDERSLLEVMSSSALSTGRDIIIHTLYTCKYKS